MPDEQFEQIITKALESIPQEFLDKIDNVSITFQDQPTRWQLKKVNVHGGLLLGLYEGIPKTKGARYIMKLPDKITLFKIPILIVSGTLDNVVRQVRDTLIHEIAHHFGMDEEGVRDAEASRKIKYEK